MGDWIGNKESVYKIIGASNHAKDERSKHDYYATPPVAIDMLLGKVELPLQILEPACGEGHLSKRLEEHGRVVKSYDIIDRGYGGVMDFMKMKEPPFSGNFAIITNPPYNKAKEFVLHSLDLVPENGLVCMFLKTTFVEGKKRYRDIFKANRPMFVLQFIKRVFCAKNGDFNHIVDIGGSSVAYAWYVWKKGYKGQTILDWI